MFVTVAGWVTRKDNPADFHPQTYSTGLNMASELNCIIRDGSIERG